MKTISREEWMKKREQSTEEVLAQVMELTLPESAKVEQVGGWVWVTFPDRPALEIRQTLSDIGFHFNHKRQAWQHPCGNFVRGGSDEDPREKYGAELVTA